MCDVIMVADELTIDLHQVLSRLSAWRETGMIASAQWACKENDELAIMAISKIISKRLTAKKHANVLLIFKWSALSCAENASRQMIHQKGSLK